MHFNCLVKHLLLTNNTELNILPCLSDSLLLLSSLFSVGEPEILKTGPYSHRVCSTWCSGLQYSQACSHPCCLCTFSYPNSSFQSTLHLICFDTALCEEPHLSVMTLCDLPSLWRVSIIVFWIIAKSAVFPIIVVSKNKRYPECIL